MRQQCAGGADAACTPTPRSRALRIFYAAHPSPNVVQFPQSQLWHYNLYLPLVDLGHDVVQLDYDLTPHFQNLNPAVPSQRRFIETHRPKLEAALLHQIEVEHRKKPIDVFFSYFYSACARPEVIRSIARMGIVTVNWYCNGSYQFHLVEEIAPAYDYCLVPEEYRLDDYRRIGANPIYSQEAANPNVYKPYDLPIEYDVAFVGARYADRPVYIRRLLDAGVDVRVWGAGWLPPSTVMSARERWRHRIELVRSGRVWPLLRQRLSGTPAPSTRAPAVPIPPEICGPPLDDESLVKMYSRAKIHLGFSTAGETQAEQKRLVQIRLRDFEAPMSGAFYMTEYQEELEQFFEVGKEVVCYTDPDDMLEKVRYYLRHDDERERIRLAGRARALRDHTWHARFQAAFHAMGLPRA